MKIEDISDENGQNRQHLKIVANKFRHQHRCSLTSDYAGIYLLVTNDVGELSLVAKSGISGGQHPFLSPKSVNNIFIASCWLYLVDLNGSYDDFHFGILPFELIFDFLCCRFKFFCIVKQISCTFVKLIQLSITFQNLNNDQEIEYFQSTE